MSVAVSCSRSRGYSRSLNTSNWRARCYSAVIKGVLRLFTRESPLGCAFPPLKRTGRSREFLPRGDLRRGCLVFRR